jgi:hypothetical protein
MRNTESKSKKAQKSASKYGNGQLKCANNGQDDFNYVRQLNPYPSYYFNAWMIFDFEWKVDVLYQFNEYTFNSENNAEGFGFGMAFLVNKWKWSWVDCQFREGSDYFLLIL